MKITVQPGKYSEPPNPTDFGQWVFVAVRPLNPTANPAEQHPVPLLLSWDINRRESAAQDHESAYKNYLSPTAHRHRSQQRILGNPQATNALRPLIICQ